MNFIIHPLLLNLFNRETVDSFESLGSKEPTVMSQDILFCVLFDCL